MEHTDSTERAISEHQNKSQYNRSLKYCVLLFKESLTGNLKWFDGGLLFGGFALLTVGELRRAGVRLRSGQRSGSGSAFKDHSLADLQSRGEDAEMK